MSAGPLADSLRLTLMVGAAVREATAEQAERLRTELLPVIEEWTLRASAPGDVEPLFATLREIMGADWRPAQEYQDYLDVLDGTGGEQCPYGDPTCPCPDGLACHYEGPDPMSPPPL